MSEPILDPEYWKERLKDAEDHGALHRAVFLCPDYRWMRIEAAHRNILAATIKPNESILDVGCGYGRLLTLMPEDWQGNYMGIDLAPSLIEKAKTLHPHRGFMVDDILAPKLGQIDEEYDLSYSWAVMISIRPMMRRELGEDKWAIAEANIRKLAQRLLYLEYDPDDGGSVE